MNEQPRWITRPYDGYHLKDLPSAPDPELTAVGPGTPCGEYLRRFWQPVAMATQLGERPLAIRALGEDLVVFRDRSGDVGLVHKHCAHRRMSLEFGRIEEHGIRCAYHGWHYGVDGRILETPGEPPESAIGERICLGAYPTVEFKGLVFAYFGPPEERPAFCHFDSFDIPGHDMVPYSIHSPCNWLQESENSIDPFHSVFLHGRVNGPQFPGLEHFVELPVVEYLQTDYGFVYSHARRVGDLVMIRFHDHLTPNFAQNGGMFQKFSRPTFFGRPSLTKWVVPIDDTNSRKFGWRHFNDADEVLRQGDKSSVGWEKVDFYGQSAHRSYEEMQANPGDWEAWVSQGPINVHQREYLATTDRGVAMLRTRLRKHIRGLAKGKRPPLPEGSPQRPVHTYGGDTVLRVPRRNEDERPLLAELQIRVRDVYLDGDRFEGPERAAFLQRELAALSG